MSASSYEAKAIEAIAYLVAGSASFQTAAGVDSEAAARSRIILVDGGAAETQGGRLYAWTGALFEPDEVPAFAHVGYQPPEATSDQASPNLLRLSGTCMVLLRARSSVPMSPPGGAIWALNLLGLVRAEMQAQVGVTLTQHTNLSITSGVLALPRPGAWDREYTHLSLTCSWSDLP